MAAHSFQQELDPVTHEMKRSEHPVLRGLMADQRAAHAEEVRLLRQRVAVLESALTAATASQVVPPSKVSTQAAPVRRLAPVSVFSAPVTPAVVAVAPASEHNDSVSQVPAASEEAVRAMPDQGFAAAWSDDESSNSFEERIAEKAFFQVGVVDESSRNWLLTS